MQEDDNILKFPTPDAPRRAYGNAIVTEELAAVASACEIAAELTQDTTQITESDYRITEEGLLLALSSLRRTIMLMQKHYTAKLGLK